MDFQSVRRVLIYRLGSLGDTVVALPALHLIERTFPNARRVLLTNIPVQSKAAPAQAVLDGSGLVHGYMAYPVGTRNPRELLPLWWQIRKLRPQVLVYLMARRSDRATLRDARFFHLCGVQRIIGLPMGDLAEHQFDPATNLWESEAARLLRCVQPLGSADVADLGNWDLRLTAAEQQEARNILAPLAGTPLLACGPGTKMQAKDWGEENWRALLARLTHQLNNHALILVGGAEDIPAAEHVAAAWQGPVLNLCGRLTPRQTAAVLQHAELFLGPDSGPMHLAAACGVACAIPFAARQYPGEWYPAGTKHRIVYHRVECWNCFLEVCVEKAKICLTSITVEEMFSAATEAWKNGQRARDVHLAGT
jgi:heptosyltransferase-3